MHEFYKNNEINKFRLIDKILDESDNAVYIHRKLKYVYMNKKGAELLGVDDPESIIGVDIREYIDLDMDIVTPDTFIAALNGEPIVPYSEDTFYHKKGHEIKMKISVENLELDGKNYVKVICNNVPEKQKILELQERVLIEEEKARVREERERLKDEFFANLSHELRTPLTIILAGLQLMENREEHLNPKEDKSFKSVRNNGYRMLRLVNNLLDMTKIDAGYFEILKSNNNIVYLVEDVVDSVAEYAESKGIKVQFDTDIEEKIVKCNTECMERVILNLLSNAVKFTLAGGEISVNVFDMEDKVRIQVKDTGIGIKKENQHSIFQRFRQVDKSFRRAQEGSGIGLSLVKSIIDMHQGDVWVESEYGEGSVFTLELDATEDKDNFISKEILEKDNYIKQKVNVEFSDVKI